MAVRRFKYSRKPFVHLSLLLGGGGFRLGHLLPVALDHDDAKKGADDGRAQQDEDDGDADGPNARGEEVLERVVRVDKGLGRALLVCEVEGRDEGNGSLYVGVYTYHE